MRLLRRVTVAGLHKQIVLLEKVMMQQVLQTSYPRVSLYSGSQVGRNGSDPFVDAAHKTLSLAPTRYSTLFFSKLNMDTIQQALRNRIQAKLGVVIDRQSYDDLSVIMRAVFVNWQRQPASDDLVPCSVAQLNSVVMKIILPQVASGVTSYMRYLKDASQLPAPMPHPVATSVAGTKNLPIFSGV